MMPKSTFINRETFSKMQSRLMPVHVSWDNGLKGSSASSLHFCSNSSFYFLIKVTDADSSRHEHYSVVASDKGELEEEIRRCLSISEIDKCYSIERQFRGLYIAKEVEANS